MANNFDSGISKKIAKGIMDNFQSQRVLTKTIRTSGNGLDFEPGTGDKIYIQCPHEAVAVETVDGDITGLNADQTSGSAVVTVQNYITTFAEWRNLDEAINLGGEAFDDIMSSLATRLITKLESNLGKYMQKNSGLLSGTPGTVISKWSDIAATNTMLESLGVPVDDRNAFCVINPAVRETLANVQTGLASGDNSLVNDAWRRAEISRDFGGVRALSSNALPSYQSGASTTRTGTVQATPNATYLAAKDTMTQTITLTDLSTTVTDAIRPGDQIRITQANRVRINPHTKEIVVLPTGAPMQWTYTVVSGGSTNGTGQVTITVTGAAINEANGAYNNIFTPIQAGDTFALLGTANTIYQPALFYHRDAFAMTTIKLPKLYSTDTVVTSKDGISIRVSKYANGDKNTNKVRFDILPAYGVMNPLWAGNAFGV